MRKKSGLKLFLIILCIAIASYIALNGLEIGIYRIVPLGEGVQQGLDLKGGLYVVYEADIAPGDPDRDNKIEGAIRVMRNRLDRANQHEATIAPQGTNRIVVEIPGVSNPQELADILMKPAVLEFIGPEGDVIITGKDVKSAKPGYITGQKPVVHFELHPEGAKKFAEATEKYLGKVIKIVLDGNPISQPKVNEEIPNGQGVIEGMENIEEAKTLANLIESGALPVELKQVEVRTIGATLGANALERGILAGIVGLSLVFLFMLVYYRLPGLVADLALVVYALLVMLITVVARITITLPGIAGIVLSIGMAVDANVLIFERMKEELRAGKTMRAALDAGFSKAFSAILDSNVTTLIAGVVLLYFGTGPIQGFAKTLMLGVVVSLFTAVVFTKYVLRLIIDLNVQNKKLYGV
ncbi:protein-export SecD/SecF family membrane protein [Caldicoprobacter guelmensis]|uniref:protein translocase subunit SecD n=1 Tax=Caldicoprobacter guelmensis TaxID=1170224 RepID=UPI001959E449|nr:protein translocase subunit SecD [Caldicoprobacter guelmensis]MBM7582302.1 protein-export SecD/SecF family membrane protein [Caldicoprobacter guelmensis]